MVNYEVIYLNFDLCNMPFFFLKNKAPNETIIFLKLLFKLGMGIDYLKKFNKYL